MSKLITCAFARKWLKYPDRISSVNIRYYDPKKYDFVVTSVFIHKKGKWYDTELDEYVSLEEMCNRLNESLNYWLNVDSDASIVGYTIDRYLEVLNDVKELPSVKGRYNRLRAYNISPKKKTGKKNTYYVKLSKAYRRML